MNELRNEDPQLNYSADQEDEISKTFYYTNASEIPSELSRVIIYTKKLLNSDWLRKECSSSVTRVQNV